MNELNEKMKKGILRLAVDIGSIVTSGRGDEVLESLITFYEEAKKLPRDLRREYDEDFCFLFSLLGDRSELLSRKGKKRFLEYVSSDPVLRMKLDYEIKKVKTELRRSVWSSLYYF